MKVGLFPVGIASTIAMSSFAQAQSDRATGVTGEAVDDYYTAQCILDSQIICIAEMDNFRNGLLSAPSTIFTYGARYTNASVFDTDFSDPDVSGGFSYDADSYNFDQPTDGIAYVSLHGTCTDDTTQVCTHSSQCTNPIPASGQSGTGVCIGPAPHTGTNGWCAYYTDKNLITSACGGAGAHHGGKVTYSNGHVKWGETPFVGPWAGAGTNGGINFGLLVNSCGVRPGFIQQESTPLFAGMTVLGMVMPITPQFADDVDAAARGTALANAYTTNPNGSIGYAWADSIVGIPYSDGADCNAGTNYAYYGGGYGMNGCGAQITIAVDIDSYWAWWDRDTENWTQATYHEYDSAGYGWWTYKYHCNYDCNTYPWILN